MNQKEILFVIHKQDEAAFQACKTSIEALKVPEGYSSKTAVWEDKDNISLADVYSQLQTPANAKYKIYLDEKIGFINENFIEEILRVFAEDENIGALGLMGAKKMPLSCRWQDAEQCFGGCYCLDNHGNPYEYTFTAVTDGSYEQVQCLDGILLATQYDVEWRKDMFCDDATGRLAQSMEFIRNGYKIVVPKQKNWWCLYAGSASAAIDGTAREIFMQEYASYLGEAHVPEDMDCLFYGFGHNSNIGHGYRVSSPEATYIGNNVHIQQNISLEVFHKDREIKQRIYISDNCEIGNRCVISAADQIYLGPYVSLDDNVHIMDYTYGYKMVGAAASGQAVYLSENGISIGRGTKIEANVVVKKANIGRGCLIEANSVVTENIPDYCVASGNPARVKKFFDRMLGEWLDVIDENHLQELLEKRKTDKPILTIGIPTYNRSYYLNRCLRAIYNQIGDDALFEVFVSDNDSSDDTKEIVSKYSKVYSNLRYHKNPENIGGKNFEMVWSSALGEFVIAVGDDDYFEKDTLYNLVQCIYTNRKASLISMLENGPQKDMIYQGKGIDAYIERVSYVSTYISALVMRQSLFDQIKDKQKFSHTHLNQVYLQLELLSATPAFSILYGNIFANDTGEATFMAAKVCESAKLGLGSVFIEEYFDILSVYIDKGLSESIFKKDKKSVLMRMIFPWFETILRDNSCAWTIDLDIMKIYTKYYAGEVYFDKGKVMIEEYCRRNQKR